MYMRERREERERKNSERREDRAKIEKERGEAEGTVKGRAKREGEKGNEMRKRQRGTERYLGCIVVVYRIDVPLNLKERRRLEIR